VVALASVSAATAEAPFLTEEAETLQPGVGSIDFGVVYRVEPRDFGIGERDRQIDYGATRLSFGLGKLVELQLRGALTTEVTTDGQTTSNSADWIFGTKIWMFQEKRVRPSLSFLYEVKLPNGSDELGGATDETDFFGYLIASKSIGKNNFLHANLGLGILGNPFANSAQNDVGILRVGWERRLGERRTIGVEGVIRSGPKDNDDPQMVHLVYAQKIGPWVVNLGAGAGLNDDADEAIFDLGVRRRFPLWRPREPARRKPW